MAEHRRLKVGVVGAGHISTIYLTNMTTTFSDYLDVRAVSATRIESAQKQADKYGIRAMTTPDLLADPEIELVVNLTPVPAHYDIIKTALTNGKHVYTEKVITDDLDKAKELLALAKEKGLYLASAPDTFLGSALQSAKKALEEGVIGEVTSFSATASRNNWLMLSAYSFLRMPGGGTCLDYGVYYLTAIVSLLGAVDEVCAIVKAPFKKHVCINPLAKEYGQEMDTPNESEVAALLQMKSGVMGTFTLDADTGVTDRNTFILHGTKGVMLLENPNNFGGTVKVYTGENDPALYPDWWEQKVEEEILAPANPYTENSRGVGPADIAASLEKGVPCHADAQLAVHVLDVLTSMIRSGGTHAFEKTTTDCAVPEFFPGL